MKLPSISVPNTNPMLFSAVRSMKQILDRLLGRLDPLEAMVTWEDLIRTGVVTEQQARARIAQANSEG